MSIYVPQYMGQDILNGLTFMHADYDLLVNVLCYGCGHVRYGKRQER